jgi:hypothetical protein
MFGCVQANMLRQNEHQSRPLETYCAVFNDLTLYPDVITFDKRMRGWPALKIYIFTGASMLRRVTGNVKRVARLTSYSLNSL